MITYQEAYDAALRIGSATRNQGVNPGDRCGIYRSNCPEWIISMEACNSQAVTYVPLYDSLVEFIVNHAEVKIAFVQENKLPSVTIVSFANASTTQEKEAEELGVSVFSWKEFSELDVRYLMDDVQELKPTAFCAIVYSPSNVKAKNSKLRNMENGFPHEKASPLMDKFVFEKVRRALGGKVRIMLSGAAPLPRHVEEFLRVSCCSNLSQGYGLTETCGGCYTSLENVMSTIGTVGGNTLFSGCYKRQDLTGEVVTDGWFHTGDIGELQPDGTMKIIDRKKNIFKLSQSEYVAVENIENTLLALPSYSIVPERKALEDWAMEHNEPIDFKSLCENPKAKKYILDELNNTGKKHQASR
ncbi:RING/U-box superfamily protein [Hibiscus syriacus]|uniref:RING/U-box superfamily protein n=1 Tax=Hibiscus syriacus TaxID=106335 RepID=A0A6A2ZFC0_HIBSY|nr:RING/U-box superfamily protein [Hibiscus syriacus]